MKFQKLYEPISPKATPKMFGYCGIRNPTASVDEDRKLKKN